MGGVSKKKVSDANKNLKRARRTQRKQMVLELNTYRVPAAVVGIQKDIAKDKSVLRKAKMAEEKLKKAQQIAENKARKEKENLFKKQAKLRKTGKKT